MAKSNFIVRGGADFSAIPKELQKLQGQFNGFSKTLGAGLKIAAASTILKGLVNFGKESLQVASDLQEVQNVVDVTFGSMSKEVDNFASNALKQFGLSELSAKKFTSTMGAMLKSSGLSGAQAKDMSIEVAKLTADMASFYNLDHEETFTKIQAGLSGETEPLKRLGINMNVANMEAYAMSQGINKAWREMSQAEQTMLRYNYLLSVTGDAQGDFARTSGSWANQVKLLKEQWKEFMGLIGQALTKILLPIVKALNIMLEALINIAKEIGKIYTMITGKEVAVESNNSIADTASDAAEGEEDLADGIGKAASAAKKALAPFDELNVLQSNLSGIGSGFSELGNLDGGNGLNTSLTTTKVDNGFNEAREDGEKYFVWFENRWKGLRQTLEMPIMVPAPVFAEIPNPIYKPNWGLTPPLIPQVIFKPIEQTEYSFSLEGIKIKTAEAFTWLENKQSEFAEKYNFKFSEAFGLAESNFGIHQTNMGLIGTAISTTLLANYNEALAKIGINTNSTITATQSNWQTWGASLGGIAIETAKSFASNIAEGFRVTAQNAVNFANGHLESLKSWGSGVLVTAAETSRGFVNNMVSGFSTVWNNFNNLMTGMGEKVSGWYQENKKLVLTTAIIGGAVLAAGALVLAAPAIIPYAAPALGGLAAIPAFAKGGVTSSPTLAMFGEYPGARSNPEITTPQNIMYDTVTEATSIGFIAVVEAVQRLERTLKEKNMTAVIGKDDIGKTAIEFINEQTIINGETPILI